MTFQLLATTWRICIFRAGPQDLPAQSQAVANAVLIALAVNLAQFQLSLPLLAAVVQSIVAVMVLWSFTAGVMTLRKTPERAPQTASALLLTNALLSVALIPFLMPMLPAMEQLATNPEADVQIPALAMFGTLAISGWGLAVSVRVFREALESGFAMALLCALGLAVAVYVIAGGVGALLNPRA